MKTLFFPLTVFAAMLTASAQTASTAPHKARSTATTHAASATGGCLKLEPTSPKIPALPASASCPKPLYTVTKLASVKADYVSPLVSPSLREALESGNQTFTLGYVDIVVGTGAPAAAGKYISVKYTGYLMDGTKFDSSDDHPGKEAIDLPYGEHQVIQGWDTGFEGMRVGGKRRLFIPYQLAYGEAGKGPIPAKAPLLFDVELVGVSDGPPKHAQPPTPDVKRAMPPAGAVPQAAVPQAGATTKPAQGAAPAANSEPKK
jgi:peptidylprolyl isomerase